MRSYIYFEENTYPNALSRVLRISGGVFFLEGGVLMDWGVLEGITVSYMHMTRTTYILYLGGGGACISVVCIFVCSYKCQSHRS